MRTIRFVGNDIRQKEFATAVRKNVNEYFRENGISKKGDWTMTAQTVIMLSAYIIPFVLVCTLPMSFGMACLLMSLSGIGAAGVGMCIMHGAAHASFSDKEWLNEILAGTMYMLGSGVTNWKIQHNMMHHTYTNILAHDEDIASKGPIRLSEHAPLKKIHKYQYLHAFFFYGMMTLFKLFGDFRKLKLYKKEGLMRQQNVTDTSETIKLILVKTLYLAIFIGLPILITPFHWWQVIILFLIMHWFVGFILSTVFQLAHVVEGAEQIEPNEHGIIELEWAVHELRTTSDFGRNNHLLNWYVGGLNFQIEHHLFPNICHIHYPKIAPIVERTAIEYGIPYNLKPRFRDALASHVKRLKELGNQVAIN